MSTVASNINSDAPAQEAVVNCVLSQPPKSFFLFAGAGSGKTRTLITALEAIQKVRGKQYNNAGQQVGVITYTNAACEEIIRRVKHDPLFDIRTIHSFTWELIRGFNDDIRAFLEVSISQEIAELQADLAKGKPGTKIALERVKKIQSKTKRLANLGNTKKFIYSPTGDNRERDALNHSEVINITADFLINKPLMKRLLYCKYPLLLVDESQDTNKAFIESLTAIQSESPNKFALGLIGDMMQRIYAEGKPSLGREVPTSWAQPMLKMNHRCPKRIVKLINTIRINVDGIQQTPRSDRAEGHARFFICRQESGNKAEMELAIRHRMSEVCADQEWSNVESVKTLILEHLMAARRMGFQEIFEPLYRIEKFRTGLLDGSLPLLRLFTQQALTLYLASLKSDDFAIAALIRAYSPLLNDISSRESGEIQQRRLRSAQRAVEQLIELLRTNPALSAVLNRIHATKLFQIPEALVPFAETPDESVVAEAAAEPAPTEKDDEFTKINEFLAAPFEQVAKYLAYVEGDAPFDTHQGVKGLEFPRVLVVIDDDEAAGFSFSYDKLFGVKEKTRTDIENEKSGKDTGIIKTQRLFYVTCSRSQQSLAIVAHTSNPKALKETVIANGWFLPEEIELVA